MLLDGKWQSYTCRHQHSSAQTLSSFSHSMFHDLFALCVSGRQTKQNNVREVCAWMLIMQYFCHCKMLKLFPYVHLWDCMKLGMCLESSVPESESGSNRSRPPTLLTMLRRWIAVQAKGIRKRPRRLHDCSACKRSFSSFSLCWSGQR